MVLPEGVERLLWEYDSSSLVEKEELPEIVVERVMARGGWQEMRWLLETCDRENLRCFLERRGFRVLPPRELAFWALACSVPEEQSSVWVHQARDREKAWRG